MATTHREGSVVQHEGPTPPVDPAHVESLTAPAALTPASAPIAEPEPAASVSPTTRVKGAKTPPLTAPASARKAKKR